MRAPDCSQRIILNFLPIATGGGLQNGLSFLDTLSEVPGLKALCIAVVREGSDLHQFCLSSMIAHHSVGGRMLGRLAFELGCRSIFSKGQLCFTLFGPPMLSSSSYLNNVVGCAYSNLFYPEIPFWHFKKGIGLWRTRLIDEYRKQSMATADYWIFETEVLKRRSVDLCGFPQERVGVVRMAPSSLVSPDKVCKEVSGRYDGIIGDGFRLLFLCGPHPNKRLDRLPDIAERLKKYYDLKFRFVLTLPGGNSYARKILSEFERRGLSSYVCNVGPVRQQDVSSLIHCVDALGTLSRLESFSNNFVEAWAMRKVLFVTNSDWAKDSCGEGAIYLNPELPNQSAERIVRIMCDRDLRRSMIIRGADQIAKYPTPRQKFEFYWNHIEKARELGKFPKESKKRILWPRNIQYAGSKSGML